MDGIEKVVGVGENVTVFGQPARYFALAILFLPMCKPPVLTKHTVAIVSILLQ